MYYIVRKRRYEGHYYDVLMGAMASQITSLTIVYSTIYSGADQKKTSKLHVTVLHVGNSPVTGEFAAQMASNAENVSIWWRHHDNVDYFPYFSVFELLAPGQSYDCPIASKWS